MNDEERARLLVKGMASQLHLSPDAQERLLRALEDALPKSRAGTITQAELRRIVAIALEGR